MKVWYSLLFSQCFWIIGCYIWCYLGPEYVYSTYGCGSFSHTLSPLLKSRVPSLYVDCTHVRHRDGVLAQILTYRSGTLDII